MNGKKLRYSSNKEKDQVTVDGIRSTLEQTKALCETFNIHQSFYQIKAQFNFEFFIYKKKSSWIRCLDGKNKINFKYNIYKANLLGCSERIIGEVYVLEFSFDDRSTICIKVKDSCYPKKTLIKHLLNSMFA
jgi:hypothetical protein